MQTILIYAAKAMVYSGIFFGYYCFALRNKRFHYYNRFYLLMAVLLSLLLPFLTVELWQLSSQNPQIIKMLSVTQVNSLEAVSSARQFSFAWSDAGVLLYNLIALYLLLTLLFSVVTLVRFKNKFGVEMIGDINFINTDLEQAPFSFFNNLFWKSSLDITATAGRQIFTHELTHIRQKHSWDKLLLRMATAFFWFNPFYWLIQKELALLHEFIADENAIEDKSAEAFAIMILQSQNARNIFSPAQSFYYSPIKRRLLMLTTSSHTSYSYARRIMVLPLLAVTVLFFAFRLKNDPSKNVDLIVNAPFVLVVDAGHGGTDDGAPGMNLTEKNVNLLLAKKIKALAPEYGITVKLTRDEDVTIGLRERMNYIKDIHPDACISIHTNATDEHQTNKNEIAVYVPRRITNETYNKSRLLGSSLLQFTKKDFHTNQTLLQRKEKGIYLVDANPYPAVAFQCGYINNENDFRELTNEAWIEKMARDILQGVAAFANADKKDLRDAADALTIIDTSFIDTTGKKAPLYLVDDQETSATDVQAIDAATIQSVNVLKGDAITIKKYGDKAENGVVLITLKNNTSNHFKTVPSSINSSSIDTSIKPLYIIDGKEYDKKDLNQISPDAIESINVLKGDEAVKKYGEKGRQGVVEIHTKAATDKTKQPGFLDTPQPEKDGTKSNVENEISGNQDSEKFEKVFSVTETPPSFPGGKEGLEKYLERNLSTAVLTQKKAPAGEYRVVVSFIVADDDGNLSDVKAKNDPGYGTAAEAVRVIKRGPKWIPAVQNGHNVTAITNQTITFKVK